jgi:hypothetical protein
MEEFSPQELSEAIVLLGGQPEEHLAHFLDRIKLNTAGPQPSLKSRSGRGTRSAHTLDAIRETEPEKYQLLRVFETQLLEGERLRTLHDVRSFGQMLDKEFDPGKSRHDGIGRLLKKLAELGLDELREVIRRAPASNVEESEAYLRLSRHIISGGKDSEAQAD